MPAPACTNCNTPIPANAAFCPACGVATPPQFDPTTGAATLAESSGPHSDLAARRAELQRALGAAFELREMIGQGGFGEVWGAWDTRLKRDVAVKVLLADLAASPGLHQRFAREAEAAARLRHPNIIPIYQVGEAAGLAFIIMPLVKGESLRALMIRSGAMAIPEARRILYEAASALEAAHKSGIVHRDVKPENIMLEGDERRVLLMDFGIARAVEADSARLTGTGLVIGTPQYMSPEQATAEKHIDHRADIYSLGVVGFEMLTGKLPFDSDNARDLILQHLSVDAKDPRTIKPDIPEDLAEAVLKCLGKTPGDRFTSAGELASVAMPKVTISVESPLQWLGRRMRAQTRGARKRQRMALGAFVLVLAVLAVFQRAQIGRSLYFWRGTLGLLPEEPAEPAPAAPDSTNIWSHNTSFFNSGFSPYLATIGDTLAVIRQPGGGPVLFDGRSWRPLPIPGITVLPSLAFDGTHWIYATDGTISVGYEITPQGPVPRDTVRGTVTAAWSANGVGLLGSNDGALLRGRPGAWRREPTGTNRRILRIFGDSARQFAVSGRGDESTLLRFNGLNWLPMPTHATDARWIVQEGAALPDGSMLIAGHRCEDGCRGMVARLAPGADAWTPLDPHGGTGFAFGAILAAPNREIWLTGGGGGMCTSRCLYRIGATAAESLLALGPAQEHVVLLRGTLIAMGSEGQVWSHRDGQWGLLGVVPGSTLRGVLSETVGWSEATVLRAGLAGVRRIAVNELNGANTVWFGQRPTLFYGFTCRRGVGLTATVSAEWDNVATIIDDAGKHVAFNDDGGGNFNALIEWECPDDRGYRIGVGAWNRTTAGTFRLTFRATSGDSVRAAPVPAQGGPIAIGSAVTGTLDDGARRLRLTLGDSGTLFAEDCIIGRRCAPAAEIVAPGRVVDVAPAAEGFIAATAEGVYRRTASGWAPMPSDGPMGAVVAVASGMYRDLVALTSDAVWRWHDGRARWLRWQTLPAYAGRGLHLAAGPGRAVAVVAEASAVLLRDSLEALELERSRATPAAGVLILPDGRIVLSYPSDDPLVAGKLVVFKATSSTTPRSAELRPPPGRNVAGLAFDDERLIVASSAWTRLSIKLEHIPLGPDTTRTP